MTEPGEQPEQTEPHLVDYETPEVPGDSISQTADAREDELDGVRIRQLAALRRGAYRARSYAIIGSVACFVVVVQLVLMTVKNVRASGWGLYPIGYIQGACAAAGAWPLLRPAGAGGAPRDSNARPSAP
jgi:hypothetical protein